ncbi:MAG: hypothetical protein KKF62_13120 [Bacteroidetes bacterium]|nr:hypothetical protein [Bacteroidota bacterium]MBU1114903.1 hypothetical protein [Bacteroidota bacterium]MBU1799387.1 hypothetical protein [Bacteroidota bacterium]
MKNYIVKNIWLFVLTIALILLVLHTLQIATFKIDEITIFLLAVILLSPFVLQIKKIKYGDFEAEIDSKEIQKLKNNFETAQMNSKESQSPQTIEIDNTVKAINELSSSDFIIALAKLRIELEKVLSKLISSSNDFQKSKKLSVGAMVSIAIKKELLPGIIVESLKEVISLSNRAIHGENVKESDAKTILSIGTSLLSELYWLLQNSVLEPSSQEKITHKELDEYSEAKYEVISVIPLVDEPVKNKRILTQEGLDNLLDGYDEYAEFIVEIKKIS